MIASVLHDQRAERFEDLKTVVERLASPDLTLAEAKALRGHLADLLMVEFRSEGRYS